MVNVVSALPDRSNWQRRWNRGDRWRVTADDCDDFISVHLKSRMESNHDVVGEDALWILLRAASFQWKLDLVAQFAFANDLTSTVTIKVCVGDAVKLFVKLHIHLNRKQREIFSDIFAQKKNLSVELLRRLHDQAHT